VARKFAVEWPVYAIGFSRDGKTLAVAGKGGVSLVDPLQDRVRGRPAEAVIEKPEEGWFQSDRYFDLPEFSPDGQWLAAAEYGRSREVGQRLGFGRIWLWDVATGQVKVKKKLDEVVAVMAFSPDAKRWAFGDTWGGLGIVDLTSGQMSRERKKPMAAATVSALCFSPDGKLLAVADDPEEARAYMASPDGSMYHVPMPGGDGTIRLLDVEAKKTLRTFVDKGSEGIVALAFSAQGKTLVAMCEDGRVRVWVVASGLLDRSFRVEQQSMWHATAVFSDGAERLAVERAREAGATLWDVAAGRQIGSLPQQAGDASVMAFSSDGGLLATADVDDDQGRVVVWKIGRTGAK
jgi:WD40 repeat protein